MQVNLYCYFLYNILFLDLSNITLYNSNIDNNTCGCKYNLNFIIIPGMYRLWFFKKTRLPIITDCTFFYFTDYRLL